MNSHLDHFSRANPANLGVKGFWANVAEIVVMVLGLLLLVTALPL